MWVAAKMMVPISETEKLVLLVWDGYTVLFLYIQLNLMNIYCHLTVWRMLYRRHGNQQVLALRGLSARKVAISALNILLE